MHGLGNDFIVIDAMEKEYFPTPNDARRLCNRRTGIGADGLMLALPSQKADLRMRLLNSDGSTAEMYYNGPMQCKYNSGKKCDSCGKCLQEDWKR